MTNPNFNGPAGWTYSLPQYVSYSYALQGTPPAALTATASTQLRSGCVGATCLTIPLLAGTSGGAQQTVTTQIGEGYILSFWSFGSAGTPSQTKVYWGGTATAVATLGSPIPAGWTFNTVDLGLATSSSTLLTVLLRDDPDFAGITAVSIEPYPKVIVSKSGPISSTAGSTISFIVTVANQSSAVAATTVTLADSISAGASLGATACAASGAAVCPASLVLPITMASLPPASTLTYTIAASVGSTTTGTLTNTASISSSKISPLASVTSATATVSVLGQVKLALTKTNNATTVTAGGTTSYVLTVTNGGPANGGGAVLKDSPSPGLSCTAISCVASVSPSASCPAVLSVASLTGSGLVIPSLPANSTVTFTLDCNVTATGL